MSEESDGEEVVLNVSTYLENSTIYGPGNRFVIWFQGCSLRCKGCWNKDMWSFKENQLFKIYELFERIKASEGIEGVTFLGGEPLDQAENLSILVKMLRDEGLSIMLYTGYEYEEISGTLKEEIFLLSDIVVSGRYVETLRSVYLKWKGSENQKIIFNSGVYREYESIVDEHENDIEIHIDETGEITIAGYPEPDDIEEIIHGKNCN